MIDFTSLIVIFSWMLTISVLPGCIYLLLLSVAGLRKPKPLNDRPAFDEPIAIIVPAHNEATVIARTLENLQSIVRADGNAEVFVIADNCEDATATIAEHKGAHVLRRNNANLRGKGYALDFAFRSLTGSRFAAYVIVDADSIADPNFLQVIRLHFGAGAWALQTRYTVLNAEASAGSCLRELALSAFNCLRPRSRQALGLSVGILGNGFALRSAVVEAVPYTASSVVEDLEYHLQLLDAGYRVHFADETRVRGDMPQAQSGQKTQRARWEGGRLRMLREHGLTLALRVVKGDFRSLEPLAELLLMPLAYHGLILSILLATPVSFASGLGILGLGTLVLHMLLAAKVNGMSRRQLLRAVLQIPKYVFWKITMIRTTLLASQTTTQWIRTHRDQA